MNRHGRWPLFLTLWIASLKRSFAGMIGVLLVGCCGYASCQADSIRPLDARQQQAVTDEILMMLYQGKDKQLQAASDSLLAQGPRLTPPLQRLAQYARVRFLLAEGQPDSLSDAMDVSSGMAITHGDLAEGQFGLGLLARLDVILAARQLGVKPELQVFLLQTLQQALADAGGVTERETSNLMASVQVMVWMAQWQAGETVEMERLSQRIPLDSPWYVTALVLRAVQPLLPLASGSRDWLQALSATTTGWVADPARLDLFHLDQAMLQLQVLNTMGGASMRPVLLQALSLRLQQHIDAVRQWQHPERLEQLLQHWLGQGMMPDSAEADERFRAFVGCPAAGLIAAGRHDSGHCQSLPLRYLNQAVRSQTLRAAWVDRQESQGLRTRLAALAEVTQRLVPDARVLVAGAADDSRTETVSEDNGEGLEDETLLRGRQAAYQSQADYYYQLSQRHVYLSLLVYLAEEHQRLASYLQVVQQQQAELVQ
ncbi:hypothetical protein [Oceanobacter sp. 4_MG-2023]|uniref:hypothetical protein n=1 Tax=Oceanobacter sp. 4_MG-2023 TaxID=3062623 RepID=UPI002732EB40|nr:hypothetical protein [Oceanobacter sp. 4_MG-2023]MDP2548326.1 hypothetical protein [Oceanobacter sp. 4_MG-2023]